MSVNVHVCEHGERVFTTEPIQQALQKTQNKKLFAY